MINLDQPWSTDDQPMINLDQPMINRWSTDDQPMINRWSTDDQPMIKNFERLWVLSYIDLVLIYMYVYGCIYIFGLLYLRYLPLVNTIFVLFIL